MRLKIFQDRTSLGKAAAEQAANAIRQSIASRGKANVVAASAASQFEFLESLTAMPEIDWQHVELFHLDEYIGLPPSHPASFCRFLQDRLVSKTGIIHTHFLHGDEDPGTVINRTNEAIRRLPVDVAFVGIGENGHLAFNDPPADFSTEEPYIVVTLDATCRRQQVGEGWFDSLESVPAQAISMSVKQVLEAREILAIVPGRQKAEAVRATVEDAISPQTPASILQTHGNTMLYLDRDSSALLNRETLRTHGASIS